MEQLPTDNSIDKQLWEETITFDELKSNMIRYLRGEVPISPWCSVPLSSETYNIRDKLITINNMNLITTCGQPGTITVCTEDLSIEVQRGFLEGFIYEEYYDINKLVCLLTSNDMFVTLDYIEPYTDG